jgi:integration host factor subunit alpha
MTRIKEDIVRNVATKIKIDRSIAKNLVELILKHIKDTLASGDRVMISGFGDFKVTHKKARIGRNPKSLVTYEISERKVVVFSPSKILRKEMNFNAF